MDTIVEVVINVGAALLGAAAGAKFTSRSDRRKDKIEQERRRLERCGEACGKLDDLLAEWYTAIDNAVRFKDTPEETIAALRAFEAQPNFERRLKRILDEIGDEPSCHDLRQLAWEFRDKCLQTKMEMKVTLTQELATRFPRGYGSKKDEAMTILRARSGDFDHELSKVSDSLHRRVAELHQ
jgi:hypothetical protein